jgi:hypothetical protein
MRLMKTLLSVACACLWPLVAFAQDGVSPEAKAAQDRVSEYLTAVKAKKWAEAKKLIHPKTLQVIAERKKRLGKEDHPLAPWAAEKSDYYLTRFQVQKVEPAVLGTFVVETSEDNFQVQEKGIAEGEPASYLVGKSGGRWLIVDKKRQETFNPTSIKIGYKGYFDTSSAPTRDEEE